jgi:hypothetical protein
VASLVALGSIGDKYAASGRNAASRMAHTSHVTSHLCSAAKSIYGERAGFAKGRYRPFDAGCRRQTEWKFH